MKHGKKYNDSVKAFDASQQYDSNEALATVVNIAKAKLFIFNYLILKNH